MKIQKILILFLLVLGVNYAQAQTDSINVYDVMFIKKPAPLRMPSDTTLIQTSDTVWVNVIFKLNLPASISKVYVRLGTQQDSSDVKSRDVVVTHEEGVNYLEADHGRQKIFKNSCYLEYELNTTQYNSTQWLTIYAEDGNGNLSAKKYAQLNK